MEDKEAITHLVKIMEKYSLTDDEKEAVKQALGILSWTVLKAGAVKRMKEKRFEKRRDAMR